MKKSMRLIILSALLIPEFSPMVSAQSPSADSRRQALGVNVEETSQGLVVRSVMVGSAAVGQLELGDVLQFLAADGHPVYATQTLQQMKIAKQAIGLDVPAYLQVQRGGVKRIFSVEFGSSETTISMSRATSIDDAVLTSTDAAKPASESLSSEMASGPQAGPSLSFDRMILAELQEGKDGTELVVLTKPRWAVEQMEYAFTVTQMTPVTKERTKRIAKEVVVDGKAKTVFEEVVEQYTVNVPETVQKTEVINLRKPVEGSQRVEVSIDAIQAWTLDGHSLATEELKTRLRGIRRVFVLPLVSSEYVADPFFTTAVSPDVLVISEPAGLGPLPAIVNPAQPEASAEPNQFPPAVDAPVLEAPAPPSAEAAPPVPEAAPSVAPPAAPELPSTETPVEGSTQEQ